MSLGRHTGPFSFTDRQLRQAAGLVRRSTLDALDRLPREEHTFSPDFHRKMAPLFPRARRIEAARRWARRAVAAVLALVLGTGVWLSVDTDARAALLSWIRQTYEDSVLYRFFTPAPAGVLPTYRPTWVPEGCREVNKFYDGNILTVLYQAEDGTDSLIFDYMFYSEGALPTLLLEEGEYEFREVQVGSCPAHFYRIPDGSQSNELIWFDDRNQIMFSLASYFEFDVMVHIAESVDLVK